MSAQCETTAKKSTGAAMGFFERYLTLWVFLCIVVGIGLGHLMPQFFQTVGGLEIANINLPVAILLWLMIVPMLLRIDLKALKDVGKYWRGIGVTLFPIHATRHHHPSIKNDGFNRHSAAIDYGGC